MGEDLFNINLSMVLLGSKRLSYDEKQVEMLLLPSAIHVTITMEDHKDTIVLDERVELDQFKEGAIGYGLYWEGAIIE